MVLLLRSTSGVFLYLGPCCYSAVGSVQWVRGVGSGTHLFKETSSGVETDITGSSETNASRPDPSSKVKK